MQTKMRKPHPLKGHAGRSSGGFQGQDRSGQERSSELPPTGPDPQLRWEHGLGASSPPRPLACRFEQIPAFPVPPLLHPQGRAELCTHFTPLWRSSLQGRRGAHAAANHLSTTMSRTRRTALYLHLECAPAPAPLRGGASGARTFIRFPQPQWRTRIRTKARLKPKPKSG